MVDWSGGNDTGARPRKDAIWACVVRQGVAEDPIYLRNRARAEDWLATLIEGELTAGRRLALGFDFPFGYPAGFAEELTGRPEPLALWRWFAERVEDAPTGNNRFDIAGMLNERWGGNGPFWGNGLKRDITGLPRRKTFYHNPFPDRQAGGTSRQGQFYLLADVRCGLRRRAGDDGAAGAASPPRAVCAPYGGLAVRATGRTGGAVGDLADVAGRPGTGGLDQGCLASAPRRTGPRLPPCGRPEADVDRDRPYRIGRGLDSRRGA